MGDAEALGTYAAVVALGQAGLALSAHFRARVQAAAQAHDESDRVRRVLREWAPLLLLCAGAVVGAALLAQAIADVFFGPEYEGAATLIRFVAVSASAQLMLDVVHGLLTVLGLRRQMIFTASLGAVATIAMLALLVPALGPVGRPFSTAVAATVRRRGLICFRELRSKGQGGGQRIKVDVHHQIRWSRYKGRVFSALHRIADADADVDVRFLQIADTDSDRAGLGGVDLSYHRYPHELLFPGAYDTIPRTTLMWTLFDRVYRSDADVVAIAGYDRPEHWAMLAAAILSRKRRAVFCDSTLLDGARCTVKRLLKRWFFARCDAFLAYGSRSAALLRYHGARDDDVFEPCQAAALPDAYSVLDALEARTRGRDSAGPDLYVGRLASEKSLPTLLEAFASIVSTHPGSRLTVVGSGPERSALEASALGMGIGGAVRFTGALDGPDLAAEYSRASVLVLPSMSEPWGLVVNEALPLRLSGRRERPVRLRARARRHGETGYAFRGGDPADLAIKLAAILDDPRDVAEVADRRCQRRVAPFTPDQAAMRILEGCRHAVRARRRRPVEELCAVYEPPAPLAASE